PVAAAVTPSIVAIQVDAVAGFGSGSGVVWSAEGLIVTNHHLVEGARTIEVLFTDGLSYPAQLVGSDPLTDLAVLEVDGADLAPIRRGRVEEIGVGDQAAAVGNPLGLRGGPSVTTGIVSAFGRTLRVTVENDILYGLIQTDAPITRGSSGGALVDAQGRLIGITTAIGVSDVGAEGLGFAIPIDVVASVVADLIADGEVSHAFLGITGRTVLSQNEAGASFPAGAEISEFAEPSSLRGAGARVGDVIVAMDGEPIATIDDLIALLRKRRAGETVTITVDRAAEAIDVEVILGIRP
ncbi:MAG: S1C family serine protease, partial [Acidimicrobiia bacterium]